MAVEFFGYELLAQLSLLTMLVWQEPQFRRDMIADLVRELGIETGPLVPQSLTLDDCELVLFLNYITSVFPISNLFCERILIEAD